MKVSLRIQMLIALLLATTGARAAGKAKTPDFGPNVAVFSAATPATEIQAQRSEEHTSELQSPC